MYSEEIEGKKKVGLNHLKTANVNISEQNQ